MAGVEKEVTAQALIEEQKQLELNVHSLKLYLKSGAATRSQKAIFAKVIKQIENKSTTPNEIQEYVNSKKDLMLDYHIDTYIKPAITQLEKVHQQKELLEFKQGELQSEDSRLDVELKRELKEITKALDSTKPSFLQRIVNTISSIFSSSKKNEAIGTDAILLKEANASPQKPASASSLAHSAPPPPPLPAPPNQADRDAIDKLNTKSSEYRGPK